MLEGADVDSAVVGPHEAGAALVGGEWLAGSEINRQGDAARADGRAAGQERHRLGGPTVVAERGQG